MSSDQNRLADLICPVITPRTDKGYFDEESFSNILRHVTAGGKGANIVFPLGSIGEFNHIPHEEKLQVIDTASTVIEEEKRTWEGDLPLELAVGVTGDSIEETIELAQKAEELGAEYAVLHPIFLNVDNGQFSRNGIQEIVDQVVAQTERINWMIYNNPHIVSDKNIRTQDWQELSEHHRIVALKDNSGEFDRFQKYEEASTGKAKVYFGDEQLWLGNLTDTDGIVSGGANLFPKLWRDAANVNAGKGEWESIQHLKPLSEIYNEVSVQSFKYVLTAARIITSPKMYGPTAIRNDAEIANLGSLLDYMTTHEPIGNIQYKQPKKPDVDGNKK